MSDLTRLRELAALFRPKIVPVPESQQVDLDIDGIMNAVNEAIDDIEIKVASHDSALERLLTKNGVMHENQDILGEIKDATAEFKKEMNKLLIEIAFKFTS